MLAGGSQLGSGQGPGCTSPWLTGWGGRGGGCGATPGRSGATCVWQLCHRPYGFLWRMNHQCPRPTGRALSGSGPSSPCRGTGRCGQGCDEIPAWVSTRAMPRAAAEALRLPSVWRYRPLGRGRWRRCRLSQWQVQRAWQDGETPAMAAPWGIRAGPHQHRGSHLICWVCRALASPTPSAPLPHTLGPPSGGCQTCRWHSRVLSCG